MKVIDSMNVLRIGRCMVETRNTMKTIAKEFGVSTSTVRRYLVEVLPEINPELANQCKTIIEYHKAIRHLRGGEATKIKNRKIYGPKRKFTPIAGRDGWI